jgi:hypothetical protein
MSKYHPRDYTIFVPIFSYGEYLPRSKIQYRWFINCNKYKSGLILKRILKVLNLNKIKYGSGQKNKGR